MRVAAPSAGPAPTSAAAAEGPGFEPRLQVHVDPLLSALSEIRTHGFTAPSAQPSLPPPLKPPFPPLIHTPHPNPTLEPSFVAFFTILLSRSTMNFLCLVFSFVRFVTVIVLVWVLVTVMMNDVKQSRLQTASA